MPAVARAQTSVTVTIANPTSLARYNADGSPFQKRKLQPEGLNLRDCLDNQVIYFPINTAGFATTDNFEVWATDQSGANCADATARSGAVQTCYQINATFARTASQTVIVSAKEILKGLPTAKLPADGCRRLNAFAIKIYFLVLRGTTVAGQNPDLTINVDTQGPSALSNVRVLPGHSALTVRWDAVGEGGADDIVGSQAFCDPAPVGGAAEAGTATTPTCTFADGGATTTAFDASDEASLSDAGVTCSNTTTPGTDGTIPKSGSIPSDGTACSTSAFATGVTADSAMIAKYGCGSFENNTGSARLDKVAGAGLNDGTVYAVSVAATDSYGNIGDLSPPVCQYPEATGDFWRDYRNAGGQSGGGFCAVEGPGFPVGSFSLAAIGIVVGLSSMRRAVRRLRGRNDR